MDKDTLLELLVSAQESLTTYYNSGSRIDIEATEKFCADIERMLAEYQ